MTDVVCLADDMRSTTTTKKKKKVRKSGPTKALRGRKGALANISLIPMEIFVEVSRRAFSLHVAKQARIDVWSHDFFWTTRLFDDLRLSLTLSLWIF